MKQKIHKIIENVSVVSVCFRKTLFMNVSPWCKHIHGVSHISMTASVEIEGTIIYILSPIVFS